MKKVLVFSALAAVAASAMAQQDSREMGRVLSAVPVVQQVPVSQQVCGSQQYMTQAPNSGTGSVLGGIAGGLVGNSFGHGGGRVAATALGIVGGALLGNSAEGPGPTYVQDVPACSTQTRYENRTVGYDVRYEYAGRQYSTRTATDPGAWVPVQVGTAGDIAPPPLPSYSGYPSSGVIEQGVVVGPSYATVAPPPVVYQSYTPDYQPVYVPTPVYTPTPVYVPRYYGGYGGYGGYGYHGGYSAPIGLSLNLGYSRGWGGHHHHRWR